MHYQEQSQKQLRVTFRLQFPSRFLHGGGGPQVGEVTRGGPPHLPCKRNHINIRAYMAWRVTTRKRVTSPTWGPPPPGKQVLNLLLFCRSCLHRRRRCSLFTQMEREFLFQPEGRPFVAENLRSNRAYHLHLNRLNRKFCLNGKCPWFSYTVPTFAEQTGISSLSSSWFS